MHSNEQSDVNDFSLLKEMARDGDRVLVVALEADIRVPGNLGLRPYYIRPAHDQTEYRQLIRQSHPVNIAAWEEFKRLTAAVVKQVGQGLAPDGVIHLLVAGPYSAGAWVGQLLTRNLRNTEVVIYQKMAGRPWHPWSVPASRLHDSSVEDVFAPVSTEGSRGEKPSIVLAIDVTHRVDPTLINRVAEGLGADTIVRLAPASGEGKIWLTTSAQVRGALRQIEETLQELQANHPGYSLHLLIAAPVSLVTAMGRMLRDSVYPVVMMYHYEPSRGFYPVMDVISGRLAQNLRHRLRIFFVEEDGRIHFELDGNVLPTSADDMDGSDGIERRLGIRRELMVGGVSEASRRLLPASVQKAIRGLEYLDIDVDLKDRSTQLSWELLCFGEDRYLSAVPGWCLYRTSRIKPILQRLNVPGRVRVLVLMPLDGDGEKGYYKRHKIETLAIPGVFEIRIEDEDLDLRKIRKILDEYQPDVLQWVGHGSPDGIDDWNAVLEVQAPRGLEKLDRLELRKLLERQSNLRLVVLCACYAGETSDHYGAPMNLLSDGVGAMVVFRDEITVGEVHTFTFAMFKALAEGQSIKDATTKGRCALFDDHAKLGASSFGAPVLMCSDVSALGPLVSPDQGHS